MGTEIWLYFAITLALGFYDSHRTWLEPGNEFAPTSCHELTPLEMRKAGYTPAGKAASYGVFGESYCPKNIFVYGERSSYVDFVSAHAAQSGQNIANGILESLNRLDASKDRLQSAGARMTAPIYIDVDLIEHIELRHYLKTLYTEVLLSNLGSGAIARNRPVNEKFRVLRVNLRKVNDPTLLFDIKLSSIVSVSKDQKTWRQL